MEGGGYFYFTQFPAVKPVPYLSRFGGIYIQQDDIVLDYIVKTWTLSSIDISNKLPKIFLISMLLYTPLSYASALSYTHRMENLKSRNVSQASHNTARL